MICTSYPWFIADVCNQRIDAQELSSLVHQLTPSITPRVIDHVVVLCCCRPDRWYVAPPLVVFLAYAWAGGCPIPLSVAPNAMGASRCPNSNATTAGPASTTTLFASRLTTGAAMVGEGPLLIVPSFLVVLCIHTYIPSLFY